MSVDWTDESEAADALRARGIETDLADAELHKHALAAVQEITARGYGPRADIEWVTYGSGGLILLDPAAASVADIEEEGIALVEDTDYRLRPGGLFLERVNGGFPSAWYGRITGITTLAVADERYDRVVTDLVKLALQYSGLEARRDGDYSEEGIGARSGGNRDYQSERDTIISELAPAGIGFA